MQEHITDIHWSMIQDRYSRLIHLISNQISGDGGTLTSKEENTQDLALTALNAIRSYMKKYPNETFTSLVDTVNFSKYLKSCLWNCKNKKGALITKKSSLYKNKISLDDYLSTEDYE